MRYAQVGAFSGLVVGLVATGCGRDPDTGEDVASVEGDHHGEHGRGYLIRDAALVLTMDPDQGTGILGQRENVDVLIIDDHIAAVGPHLDGNGVRVIDGTGMIVMPGFVDTHDHLWQSLIRGCAADDVLYGWLGRCVLPLNTFPISESDAYAGVRLGTTGLINTGVTTVADWSHAFNPDFVRGNLRALNDAGIRYAFAMFGAAFSDDDIKATKTLYVDPNPLGTFQVATHPAPGFLAGLTTRMTALAKELNVKLHVHLLESIVEVADNPMGVLEDAGAFELGRDLYTAHDVHLTDAQIAKLAELGANTSHQPLSNMRLASGIIRLPEIRAAGIRMGLGLDGGTNDTTDNFNNMRAAVGLQRAKSLDAQGSPTVAEVLRLATMGGAEALDIDGQVGSLTPGKQADVIVIDPRAANFAPQLQQLNQIVFNGQPQNVKWVFVAGRAVKSNGQVTGVNERDLVEAAQDAADHIAPVLQP